MRPMPIIVSNKIVYGAEGDYVITLRLINSKTNENRRDVIDPMYAVFRCSEAFVLDIRNKVTGEQIDTIKMSNNSMYMRYYYSQYMNRNNLVYKRNKYITITDYPW